MKVLILIVHHVDRFCDDPKHNVSKSNVDVTVSLFSVDIIFALLGGQICFQWAKQYN